MPCPRRNPALETAVPGPVALHGETDRERRRVSQSAWLRRSQHLNRIAERAWGYRSSAPTSTSPTRNRSSPCYSSSTPRRRPTRSRRSGATSQRPHDLVGVLEHFVEDMVELHSKNLVLQHVLLDEAPRLLDLKARLQEPQQLRWESTEILLRANPTGAVEETQDRGRIWWCNPSKSCRSGSESSKRPDETSRERFRRRAGGDARPLPQEGSIRGSWASTPNRRSQCRRRESSAETGPREEILRGRFIAR